MNLFTKQWRTLVFTAMLAVGTVWLAGCGGKSIGEALIEEQEKNSNGGGDNGGGGGSYESVPIGGKTWMKKNLDIKTEGSWCYGEGSQVWSDDLNDFMTISNSEVQANCTRYGRLYTWSAAKSACTKAGSGWRLPDTTDWNKLINYAGGSSIAGKKLKSTDWSSWGLDTYGTDEYGFSALPGGDRTFDDGNFHVIGENGLWWTATEDGNDNAYYRAMSFEFDDVIGGSIDKGYVAISVRCIRD